MTIKLNGDPHQLEQPLSVSALLAQLEIDARRVAVELNLAVVKKAAYDSSVIKDGTKSRSSTSSEAVRNTSHRNSETRKHRSLF